MVFRRDAAAWARASLDAPGSPSVATPHLERCRSEHAAELPTRLSTDHLVYDAAVEKLCGVDVRPEAALPVLEALVTVPVS